MIKLYDDQLEGKRLLAQSIKKGFKSIAFSAPCGYGKTVIMSDLVFGAINKGLRVWIIVDSIELIEQTRETLLNFGIKSNVIQGLHEDTDYSGKVQVVMSQTITRRWKWFDANPNWLPHLVLIDECHTKYKAHSEIKNLLEKHNQDAINKGEKPIRTVIGFSATPITKGLANVYDDLVVGSTVKDLIELERLVPVEAYACLTPTLDKIKTNSKGDYDETELAKRVNKTRIRGDIIKNWFKYGQDRKTIVYAVNVKHAEDLNADFEKAGVKTAIIKGTMNKIERAEFIEQFRNNELKVLVSVMTLVKGFDVKDIGCVILARPTKSLSLFIQMIGRGMRQNPVYKECIVIDHGDNINRLGFPEDFVLECLDDGTNGNKSDRKKKEDPLPTPCPKCNFIKPVGVHVCPKCEYKPERQANVIHETAYLNKLEKSLTTQEKRNKQHPDNRKQDFYSSLLKYCKDKNKSEGYAAHLYKDYYGVFPNKRKKIIGKHILPEAQSFITSKNIRYSKRKR